MTTPFPSRPETVGFHARIVDGGEVWGYSKRGHPVKGPLTTLNSIQVGSLVCVPNMLGHAKATVMEMRRDGSAWAESGGTGFHLDFAKDYRHCWTSSVAYDLRGIAKFSF